MLTRPANEHLGAAWEIAIVVVMGKSVPTCNPGILFDYIFSVALVAAILAATVFQIRRRRRQKQRRALEADTENGKTPKRTIGAQDRRRSGSVNTFDEIVEKHTHPVTVRDDRKIAEIQKVSFHRTSSPASDQLIGFLQPSPSLQLKQANDSSYNEYLSKKPPNYYWEQRFH